MKAYDNINNNTFVNFLSGEPIEKVESLRGRRTEQDKLLLSWGGWQEQH